MFQLTERWYTLVNYVGHRTKYAYDADGCGEALQALELLVRTEAQAAELEIIIEQAQDAFGCTFEDYLHE